MRKFIPYGKQIITKSDIKTVQDVLQSPFLTQGPKVPEFERKVSKYIGAINAVAVNSATSALHIACLAMNLSSNDILWTSPNTFVASANCGLYCGASIDFVDINKETLNICPELLKEKLINANKINKLPKVLVIVHFGGSSADMITISNLAKQYDIKIIEDASHAIGGKYNNKLIGTCEFSDITVFSFHPVKMITTGEGGMALTNNKELYKQMIFFRSHGITRDPKFLYKSAMPDWYYEQQLLGYNYRITDLQAALGINQLTRITKYVLKRNKLALYYKEQLSGLPLKFQKINGYSAYHLFVVQLKELQNKRDTIFVTLRSKNIGVNLHYYPVHLQPFYKELGFKKGDFPVAELYSSNAITLPLHPKLTIKQIDFIISSLKKAIEQ